MSINFSQLNTLLREVNELTSKPTMTKREEKRHSTLLAMIACVRAGADLRELEIENHNSESEAAGLSTIRTERAHTNLNAEQRHAAAAFQEFASTTEEQRTGVGGNPISRIGTYNSLGFFVPTDFFNQIFLGLKPHSPLFDDASVTVINTNHGRPLPVPIISDTLSVAVVQGENTSLSQDDIKRPSHVDLGAYSYKTPQWFCSREAFEDLDGSFTAQGLFQSFCSDRIRRGVGADLLNGNGVNKPLGLLNSLSLLGSSATPHITAAGSSENDGSSASGANSIGSTDLADLYASVNQDYRQSSKAAWLMSDTTLLHINSRIDKYGHPLNLVDWTGGSPKIWGKPVKIDPNMPSIGASNVTVVFGDLSYWATRIATGPSDKGGMPTSYIRSYTEASGLIEAGLVAFQAFLRADGALLFDNPSQPAPINYLQQSS